MSDSRQRLTRWLLIEGNRLLIAVLLLTGIFLLLVTFSYIGVIDIENHEAVRGVATGFIPGLIAFLSIVLAINQLVLSQEFGSAGQIYDRIQEVKEYRHDVEELAGTEPSPVLPIGFLSFVVQTIQLEASTLEDSVEAKTHSATHESVLSYSRNVASEAEQARKSLERLEPGRINALLPVLEYNDSYQLYEARRLRQNNEGELPHETKQSLTRLIEALELFSVARMQFRTTYTQRVLARLSRQLLYVGIPALIIVIVLALMPSSALPLIVGPARLVTVSALLSVASSPLAILAVYLVRVAAVSERTIAAGPFVSRPDTAHNRIGPTSGEQTIGRDTSVADAEDGNERG